MPLIKGERELGSFGALGGVLAIGIKNSPDDMAKKLVALAEYTENTQKVMQTLKAIAKHDMAARFRNDNDPAGDDWTPLDPDYAGYKAKTGGDPNDILTLSGDLERAATSEAAWGVRGTVVFFNAGALPLSKTGENYGLIHNAGSKDQSKVGLAHEYRELTRFDRENKIHAEGTVGRVRDSGGIGRGQALPKREFIGLSKAAVMQMTGALDLWFDTGVNVTINSKTGTMQERIGRRFGPKLFPTL